MENSFSQFFRFADDFWFGEVLPKLSLKDFAQLDGALCNKRARPQFLSWCARSSKSLRLGLRTNLSLMRWLKLREFVISDMCVDSDATDDVVQCCANCSFDVPTLMVTDPTISRTTMHAFLQSVRGLHHVYIHTETQKYEESSLPLLLKNNPWLASVRLKVTCSVPDAVLLAMSVHCRRLHKLCFLIHGGVVTDAGLVCLLQRCVNLITLELWDCSGVSEQSLVALAPLCAQLRDLCLPGCMCLSHSSAQQVMRSLCNLEDLNLRNCTNVPAALLVDMLHNNPTLRSLDLTGVESVTDALLAILPKACPKLQFLYISECKRVTDIQVLHRCGALLGLYMKGCTAVSDAALRELATALTHSLQVCCRGSGVNTATFRELKDHQYLQLMMY